MKLSKIGSVDTLGQNSINQVMAAKNLDEHRNIAETKTANTCNELALSNQVVSKLVEDDNMIF